VSAATGTALANLATFTLGASSEFLVSLREFSSFLASAF